MASVRLVSAQFIDYLHLTRWEGRWKTLNVLWAFRPDRAPQGTSQ
ncbi:MAG TPA: nuclear transport factor 2 family protein [Rhodothermales bacterium]|nr:nuclear transport factor 2 family protein [Rhodothermales bacterium]